MSDVCFACGERYRAANFCPYCGIDLSPTNQRHWEAVQAHESAARTAVRKAQMDSQLYSNLWGPMPPEEDIVKHVARRIADPTCDLFFPPLTAGRSRSGLHTDLVVRMALSRL